MKNSNQQQIFLFHNPIFQPKKLNEYCTAIDAVDIWKLIRIFDFQVTTPTILVMNMSHTLVDGKCEQLSFPVSARKLHL